VCHFSSSLAVMTPARDSVRLCLVVMRSTEKKTVNVRLLIRTMPCLGVLIRKTKESRIMWKLNDRQCREHHFDIPSITFKIESLPHRISRDFLFRYHFLMTVQAMIRFDGGSIRDAADSRRWKASMRANRVGIGRADSSCGSRVGADEAI
jgi:hypothetical protein